MWQGQTFLYMADAHFGHGVAIISNPATRLAVVIIMFSSSAVLFDQLNGYFFQPEIESSSLVHDRL